jgi:hypothetical protein
MKKFEVYMDTWTGHDSWSGPESAGMSLHLTKEDHKSFIEEEYKSRNNTNVPEYYENADNKLTKIFVSEDLYKQIVASKNGIRHHGTLRIRQELD